ncbi:MAG TPA: UDP-2,3-diacylglucosamine diphosphatase [Gammaproteobacteria bacterium]|nr:UDP-2,3-diacylglucosamine diphosphatase [Xanthomonadales bacterium]HOP22390.1 UDP-2,3-diacylglucosamine diphosphatase [Gammaproteobacteria bacterium]HPI94801.1 UDP-2,3-diacylglucosamine diphosphatase [Gammaproteobacteria bacterium]HPQ86394.1 UDP-2,3-diacylglucosamine diphosphatase [Gammaproteobacteria bacterium]
MSSTVLFIADLHLSPQHPEIFQRFKDFLHEKARHARALYILGDLFEYYLGDDAMDELASQTALELQQLNSKYQTECYFMPGNRDFLVSNGFAQKANLTILTDPTVIQLEDKKIILTHADELCTDDFEYQKIRTQLRSEQWQQWFLSQSIEQRIEFAKQARQKSMEHTQSASSEIMDVNPTAVENLFKQFDCQLMIHGHTHRPAFHTIEINNQQCLRMVVGDWQYQTSYIKYESGRFKLITK